MVVMDDSNRELLNKLFPGQAKELEADVEVNNYLMQIRNFGVDKLSREATRIQDDMAHTVQHTQQLAFQNYKTFVETAECSSAALREFTSVEERLDHLLAELPEFAARCAEFGRHGSDIHARRRLNSATLTKHTELLEVLELPQLMDTGVRNGYYDQAMELVTYVRGLEKKHGHIKLVEDLSEMFSVIATNETEQDWLWVYRSGNNTSQYAAQAIVGDVQLAYRLMLTQLISQLRSNSQLPQCINVIGHLRRMEVYTEFELRLKFLQARNVWLEEQLSNISRDDPYHHISKTIEVSRVSLFDIVTQYRAVFSDESALLQATTDDAAPAIFYEWINLKVNQFLETLHQDLDRGVGDRLDSLLSQTMYFGLSLARIGADLRPLAVPLFQQATLEQFRRATAAATARFRHGMDAFTCMKVRVSTPATPLQVASSQDSLQPPASLLDYLPLARYCNNLLSAFNKLRLCPALGLVCDVTCIVRDSLASVVSRVVDLYHTDSQGLTAAERCNYSRFCHCLARELVPFLSGCLAAVFSADQLSAALGLSASVLRTKGIGCLDIDTLVSPLREFIIDWEPVPSTSNARQHSEQTAQRLLQVAPATASGLDETAATEACSETVPDITIAAAVSQVMVDTEPAVMVESALGTAQAVQESTQNTAHGTTLENTAHPVPKEMLKNTPTLELTVKSTDRIQTGETESVAQSVTQSTPTLGLTVESTDRVQTGETESVAQPVTQSTPTLGLTVESTDRVQTGSTTESVAQPVTQGTEAHTQ